MNSTAKITSLVAVLVLCCAGLAGSAYAYTATYVDTIDSQPIEDVYVVIRNAADGSIYGQSETVGEVTTYALDLDVEYNTLNTNTVEDACTVYYNIAAAKVQNEVANPDAVDGFTAVVDKTAQTVTFSGIIDAVSLAAYGDNATGKLTVSGLMAADSGKGIKSITYTLLDAADNTLGTSNTTEVTFTSDMVLNVSEDAKVVKLKVDILVSTLNINEKVVKTFGTYYAPANPVVGTTTLLNNITVVSAPEVVYTFTASQVTPAADDSDEEP